MIRVPVRRRVSRSFGGPVAQGLPPVYELPAPRPIGPYPTRRSKDRG
jgi:hypothetical protein